MAKQRAHKAAAAAERAEKDTQFKAYQILSDNDGEESAPSTPRRLLHGPSGATSPKT
jgi:hypothetical protein